MFLPNTWPPTFAACGLLSDPVPELEANVPLVYGNIRRNERTRGLNLDALSDGLESVMTKSI
jgi:hypothetical protein